MISGTLYVNDYDLECLCGQVTCKYLRFEKNVFEISYFFIFI